MPFKVVMACRSATTPPSLHEHRDQPEVLMAALKLVPGAVVTQSGFYVVSHSNGHVTDASTHLMEGLILPSCIHDGCKVTYKLVRATSHISEDHDFKDS